MAFCACEQFFEYITIVSVISFAVKQQWFCLLAVSFSCLHNSLILYCWECPGLLSSGVSVIPVCVTVALHVYQSHSFLYAPPFLPASAHVTSMMIFSM